MQVSYIFKVFAYCSNIDFALTDNEVEASYVWSRYVSLKTVLCPWDAI